MREFAPTRRARNREQGYALVLMMFFLALLVLSTVVAAPTVLSSIQREKEAEMVWRGKQYTRAIRMYYMKMHRFPTALDDLTKPKQGLRFMRQAYKDPMNTVDGSWRLIYVGPNGQLIGSLNAQTNGMFAQVGGATGVPGAPQNASFGGNTLGGSSFGSSIGGSSFGGSSFGNSSNSFGSSFGNSSFGQNAPNTTQAPAAGTAAGNPSSTDPNAQNGDSTDQSGNPQPIGGMMDASNTVGGNIIGVGSKVNKKSFLWYKKAKNYRLFEFIWDPSQDMTIGGASQGIGTPIQNGTGQNPSAPGAPTSPFAPGMNGGQNPQQNPGPGGVQDPTPLQAPPNQ